MAGAPRLVLHIGAMKTGTTYLQNLLGANAEHLAEQGWWVPDQRRVVKAVREVMALTDRGRGGPTEFPRWERLMEAARDRAGHGTVVSMEFLSFADRKRLQRVVRSSAGLDLGVVVTARDATAALPSQWQSLTRNGHPHSWPDFAVGIRSSRLGAKAPGVDAFRRTQDLPRIVETWSRAVAPESFWAVTVPRAPAPRTLLWERFLTCLEVDPAGTITEAAFDNPQVGYGTCEVLRRVNARGLDAFKASAYRKIVRQIVRGHLLGLRDQQSRPRLDRATAQFAVGLNERTRTVLAERTTLVGDLDDLPTTLDVYEPDRFDAGDRPVQVGEAEVLAAATAMHAAALAVCDDAGGRVAEELRAPSPDVEVLVDRIAAIASAAITQGAGRRARS